MSYSTLCIGALLLLIAAVAPRSDPARQSDLFDADYTPLAHSTPQPNHCDQALAAKPAARFDPSQTINE